MAAKLPFSVKTLIEWNAWEARAWLNAVVELGLELRFLDPEQRAAVRALDADYAKQMQIQAGSLYR